MNKLSIKLLLIMSIAGIINTHIIIIATPTSQSLPIISRFSKNILPANLLAEAQKSQMSILTSTSTNRAILYQSYQDGTFLFPNNADLAVKFNTMINAIKAHRDLIEFFRKIHINSLNQLYIYLMKIYTNFNLTHPGCSQDTATPTANISAYLIDEATYATNKKKLILNHFINLIQAQFSGLIISYVPTISQDMAVSLGKIFIQNDCSVDLTAFSNPQTDTAIIKKQAECIDFLKLYIDFFKTYTSYLEQNDAHGINQYYTIASTCANATTDSTTGVSKMNPPMFFYDIESMRSIQFIPFIAGTIPTNSQSIPWSPTIVNAVIKNLTMNGHPIAYFKDAAGNKTADQNQAKSLFLLIETGLALFEEELLAQPGWLNTKDGSLRILRSCLGDFSQLVGLGILDSTTEAVIQKALKNGA